MRAARWTTSVAALEFAPQKPPIDRPGDEETRRNGKSQPAPEGPDEHGLGAHSAQLIVDEVHHDLHHADRYYLADPDDLERSDEADLLIAHDGQEPERDARGVRQSGREDHHRPWCKADHRSDDQAGDLADDAAGQAMKRGVGGSAKCAPTAVAVMAVVRMLTHEIFLESAPPRDAWRGPTVRMS